MVSLLQPLLESVCDATAREVIRRQLDTDTVPGQDADEVHPQLSADVCQDAVLVLQLNGEHRIWERFDDRSLNFDRVLLGHRRRLSPGVQSMVDKARPTIWPRPPIRAQKCGQTSPAHDREVYQRSPSTGKRPRVVDYLAAPVRGVRVLEGPSRAEPPQVMQELPC